MRLLFFLVAGSAEKAVTSAWVWSDDQQCMEHRDVAFVPGLYKIFDEILVNAADHFQRGAGMDTLEVYIDEENTRVSVYNNGRGIPIQIHKEEGVYVPELIFGHLLTSSNYDDSEKKVVGGRNGYGAKLANIFSTEFVVETADQSTNRRYRQVRRQARLVRVSGARYVAWAVPGGARGVVIVVKRGTASRNVGMEPVY